MRSFLTTDGPLSSPPRRFESQLSFESIGLFSLIHKYIQTAFVRTNDCAVLDTHTRNASFNICGIFVSVCFDIVMFALHDHLFIQAFDCTLIYNLRHRHISIVLKCIYIWIGIFELIWSKNKEEEKNNIIFGLDSVSADLSSSHTLFYHKSFYLCTKYTKNENCKMSLYRLTHHMYDSWFVAFFYANTPIFPIFITQAFKILPHTFLLFLGFSFLGFFLFLSFCLDGAYERSMTVCPPPLTMITFSIIEIIMFLVDIIYFRWVIICDCKLKQFRLDDFINKLHTRVVLFFFFSVTIHVTSNKLARMWTVQLQHCSSTIRICDMKFGASFRICLCMSESCTLWWIWSFRFSWVLLWSWCINGGEWLWSIWPAF